MKKALIGVGVLIVLLIAAALIAPALIPAEVYRDQIQNRVREATGRDLTINGDVSVQIIPSVALTAEDVSFANAPGGKAETMAKFRRLDVEIKLFPLISGNIEVDRLVLVDPEINLEVDAKGTPNWAFKPAGKPSGAGEESAEDGRSTGEGRSADNIRLGDVRLENGLIRYSNAQTGAVHEINKVNLTLSLADLNSPFKAEGGLTYQERAISMDVSLETPADINTNNGAATRISISSDLLKLSFQGQTRMREALSASGRFELDTPSLRELAAWLGSPIEAANGKSFQQLALSGQIEVGPARIALEDATVRFDDIEGRGRLAVEPGGKVPTVTARLDVETLDLTPYTGGEPAAEGRSGSGQQGGESGQQEKPAQGWSREPFDTSVLRNLNANLEFNAGGIRMGKFTIGKSSVTAALSGGRLTIDLKQATLYGGTGQGRLVIDGNSADSLGLVASGIKLTGFQAEPFLRDAAGYERLSGTTNLDVPYVAGRGQHMHQLMSSLSTAQGGQLRSGMIEFTDGSLKGFNFAAKIRHAGTLFTDRSALDARDTDFTRLGGTFTIANGILSNKDLEMISPLLRLAGEGTANIGAQRVDYRIEPRAVLSLQGQGGREELGGMVVPLKCKGPWADIGCQPDLANVRIVGRDGELRLPSPENIKGLPEDLRKFLPGRRDTEGRTGEGDATQQDGGTTQQDGGTTQQDGGTTEEGEEQKPEDRIKGLIRKRLEKKDEE